jgi:hypothetical protein
MELIRWQDKTLEILDREGLNKLALYESTGRKVRPLI